MISQGSLALSEECDGSETVHPGEEMAVGEKRTSDPQCLQGSGPRIFIPVCGEKTRDSGQMLEKKVFTSDMMKRKFPIGQAKWSNLLQNILKQW